MKLFGLGKKKDERVDEHVIWKDLDEHNDNSEKQHADSIEENEDNLENNMDDDDFGNIEKIEENISGYIDLDDLDYDEYEDIVNTIEGNGWHLVSNVAYPITTLDTQLVSHNLTKANSCDVALEIVCPQDKIIGICGLNECGVDLEGFYKRPNLYQVPHFFTLMCTDVNGVELSQTTLVSILKYAKNGETEKCYEEFYGDLSPIIDGKLKRKEERYYFAETIILQSGEKLMFKINNPNTDISKIDLLMLSDLFEKDEE